MFSFFWMYQMRKEPLSLSQSSHPDTHLFWLCYTYQSIHYTLEWSSKLFEKPFQMIMRPVKSCAPIKGIGWWKYDKYLIWKKKLGGFKRCRHHGFSHPATAANIAMSQMNISTHMMMWPHKLVGLNISPSSLYWPPHFLVGW